MSGFIYLIHAEATNSVKVGYSSKDPLGRMRALQTGNADELTLLGTMRGTMADERFWHSRFASYCIRGEWFRFDGLLKEFIETSLRLGWHAAMLRRL